MLDLVEYIEGLGPVGYIYFSTVYVIAEVCALLQDVCTSASMIVHVCECASMSVHVCKCASMIVHVCECASMIVHVCEFACVYICYVVTSIRQWWL